MGLVYGMDTSCNMPKIKSELFLSVKLCNISLCIILSLEFLSEKSYPDLIFNQILLKFWWCMVQSLVTLCLKNLKEIPILTRVITSTVELGNKLRNFRVHPVQATDGYKIVNLGLLCNCISVARRLMVTGMISNFSTGSSISLWPSSLEVLSDFDFLWPVL